MAARHTRRWLSAIILILFALVMATHSQTDEVVSLGEDIAQPTAPTLDVKKPVIPGINARLGPVKNQKGQK